jgi:hypothetical protein
LENQLPLASSDISKRVAQNAIKSGFTKGTVTGHSMRKGCATAWILNLIQNKGTYSSQGNQYLFILFNYNLLKNMERLSRTRRVYWLGYQFLEYQTLH